MVFTGKEILIAGILVSMGWFGFWMLRYRRAFKAEHPGLGNLEFRNKLAHRLYTDPRYRRHARHILGSFLVMMGLIGAWLIAFGR